VDITIYPIFIRFKGLDDRVTSGMVMLGRVLVFGFIATADVAARKTKPQMNPVVPHFEACGTTLRSLRFYPRIGRL